MNVVVIGGGIHGLCAAEHLSSTENVQVCLIEQYFRQHTHGSSHGQTRITRSTYSDALYVALMQQGHNELWPELEKRLNTTVIQPVAGCFMGPISGVFQDYAKAVEDGGAKVSRITPEKARFQFPMFHFKDDDGILVDHTAGIIHASKVIDRLWKQLEKRGVQILENNTVVDIDAEAKTITLSDKTIHADKIIVCAGPWSREIFPSLLKSRYRIVQQSVSYWRLKDKNTGLPPHFPVWVELGNSAEENWYGLPSSGTEGIKVAQHRLLGDDNPNQMNRTVEPTTVQKIRSWIGRRMRVDVQALLSTETCLYSVTDNEDFIIDHHPDSADIWIGSGFSGHGFKFGPFVGRVLAESALYGRSNNHLFENNRHRFKI